MTDAEHTVKLHVSEVPASTPKRPVLVFLQGQTLGMSVPIEKEKTVIGRGTQADIVLRDEIASRLHAEIARLTLEDDIVEYYINDLGSTNGTFLNGSRVTDNQLLEDGDKIKVGNHLMKFAMVDEFEAEFQERVHQMIQRDELTGLRSRRSLFADLDRIINDENRSNPPQSIAVLMLDLDFFKRVNDGRGHLVGSHTIRDVGHIIRDILGSADLAARYGGEEFFAYLFDTREGGLEVAEKIRKEIESHPFQGSATDLTQTMHITISVGVAVYPEDGTKALDLIQKSDQALYRAKLSGRNQTCVFDPKIDRPESFRQNVDSSAIMYGPSDAQ